jgi:nucleotide-binding universal stress UspA family protein
MPTQTKINTNRTAERVTSDARPFRRMLVVLDGSPAAEAALHLVTGWVGGPGADVRFVQVSEERRQRPSGVDAERAPMQAQHLVVRAPTLGARTRQIVRGVAEAAADFGADVIVLGLDRSRLAGHRFAPSLRELLVRATDLPVLVAPSPKQEHSPHHRLVPDRHRTEERADAARPYARV